MDKDCLTKRRSEYAAHLVRYADTVSLLRPAEVNEIHKRAAAGEFDADLDWRSPHLKTSQTGYLMTEEVREQIRFRVASGQAEMWDAAVLWQHVQALESAGAPVSRGEFPCAGGPE